jgi:hypothetical protein
MQVDELSKSIFWIAFLYILLAQLLKEKFQMEVTCIHV